ncbi:MaoC/PaaZ C-terminal domain-containing protein [Nocardioides sp. Root151]|uniref:MaoC/PaaZ C-terminal domain-containing protein n=1 Tax=Nocardioides sp. Root151 TaxID=1736475 RepID=UPI00070361E5|nr:MaoC/PaaZ C-terminal domain-containing protein [Nocardioides sp. Root151]KQZ76026.1 hypothetical protein ASD66_06960 [Nocardioides sp. Root151]
MRLEAPTITRETLAAFAATSGDGNPVHLDPEAARAAGQPDVFAHGMLSMAWLGRLVTSAFPQARLAGLTVRFTAVTPLGAEPVFTLERVDETSVCLRGELADGTVTVVGRATLHV